MPSPSPSPTPFFYTSGCSYNPTCSSCASSSSCAWCSNAVGSPASNCIAYLGYAPSGCGSYASSVSSCPSGGSASSGSGGAGAPTYAPNAASVRLRGAALGTTLGLAAALALLSTCLRSRHAAARAAKAAAGHASEWAGQAVRAAPCVAAAHALLLVSLALAVAAPSAPWWQYTTSSYVYVQSALVVQSCTPSGETCTTVARTDDSPAKVGANFVFVAAALLAVAVLVTGVAAARLYAIAAGAPAPAKRGWFGLAIAESAGALALILCVAGLSRIADFFNSSYTVTDSRGLSDGGALSASAVVFLLVGMICLASGSCRARHVTGIGRGRNWCCTARASPAAGSVFSFTSAASGEYSGGGGPVAVPYAVTASHIDAASNAGVYNAYARAMQQHGLPPPPPPQGHMSADARTAAAEAEAAQIRAELAELAAARARSVGGSSPTAGASAIARAAAAEAESARIRAELAELAAAAARPAYSPRVDATEAEAARRRVEALAAARGSGGGSGGARASVASPYNFPPMVVQPARPPAPAPPKDADDDDSE